MKQFKIWKIAAIALALFSLFAAIYFWAKSKKLTTPNVTFLTAEEMQKHLNDDADHYYDKFHKTDLKVRKVKSKEDYLEKIASSACDPTTEVRDKLGHCIQKVHDKLDQMRDQVIEGIKIGELLDLKWKIGFTCDKHYENGLPHTRSDVIVLYNKDIQSRNIPEVCELLIHEKVHVYQKMFEKEMNDHIRNEYDEYQRKDYKDESIPANPDIDDYVYKSKADGKVLEAHYSKKPKHFRDVKYTENESSMEHPLENIAYKVQKIFKD